jgi:hypothetical protein
MFVGGSTARNGVFVIREEALVQNQKVRSRLWLGGYQDSVYGYGCFECILAE